MAKTSDRLTATVAGIEIDIPRSLGYYGGIALATGTGMVEAPLALFIAAVPFFKMLNGRGASKISSFVGQFYEGMAKPVGGDGEGTLALRDTVPNTRRRLQRATPGVPDPARRRSRAGLDATRSQPGRRAKPAGANRGGASRRGRSA
jgi:hypothetical protein